MTESEKAATEELLRKELAKLMSESNDAWHEMQLLMRSLEIDMAKSVAGVVVATIRARKALGLVKARAHFLRKNLQTLRNTIKKIKKNV